MPTECTAPALVKAAACYGCLLPRQKRNALLYLLCQWANHDRILLSGAGDVGANQSYISVDGGITYIGQTDPTWWIANTLGGTQAGTLNKDMGGGTVWTMAETPIPYGTNFPTTWVIQAWNSGTPPPPSGQYV